MCAYGKLENYGDGFRLSLDCSYQAIYKRKKSAGATVKKRGAIIGFSSKSARRLRDFLLTHNVGNGDYTRLAITYTLPCDVSSADWASIMHRWRQYLIRYGLAAVWRIELQRRKVPHLHVVGYTKGLEDSSNYWLAWFRACDNVLDMYGRPIVLHPGFLLYGVSMRFVRGARWYAYVASHASKHKSSQLGWRGRQWGIINRGLFLETKPFVVDLSPWLCVRLLRAIRRRYHYRNYTIDSFGSRIFFSGADIERLVEYYRSSAAIPF